MLYGIRNDVIFNGKQILKSPKLKLSGRKDDTSLRAAFRNRNKELWSNDDSTATSQVESTSAKNEQTSAAAENHQKFSDAPKPACLEQKDDDEFNRHPTDDERRFLKTLSSDFYQFVDKYSGQTDAESVLQALSAEPFALFLGEREKYYISFGIATAMYVSALNKQKRTSDDGNFVPHAHIANITGHMEAESGIPTGVWKDMLAEQGDGEGTERPVDWDLETRREMIVFSTSDVSLVDGDLPEFRDGQVIGDAVSVYSCPSYVSLPEDPTEDSYDRVAREKAAIIRLYGPKYDDSDSEI